MKKNERSVSSEVARPIGVALLLSLVVGLVLVAFAWPAVNSAPRDVPVGVVAPEAVASQVEQQLEKSQPGGFDLRRYADTAAGEHGVLDRDVYGLIVVTKPGSAQVVTASGASPAVAQALTQIGTHLSGAPPAEVKDLAPLPAEDTRGAGLAASMLPMLLGGILTTAVLSQVTANLWIRAGAVATAAAAAGVVVALVLHTWLGALGGGFWSVAGVAGLGIAAVGLTLTGLYALAGPGGLGVGAGVMMLLGNPLSGLTSAPEMLPSGWGALGQLLPPGAYGSALRSVVFFDGAAAGGPLLVLAAWVVGGIVLVGLAVLKKSRTTDDAPEAELAAV